MSKGKFVDLTGCRFGRLVVVERAENRGKNVCWHCRCDCGTNKIISTHVLRSGLSNSCGCLQREIASVYGHANATHGMTNTRIYQIWAALKARCFCPSNHRYADYGGRGITVCPEWAESFETFRDWALANGYSDDLTIDRKDNDGPYSPENCRWSSVKTQSNNRRSNVVLSYNGRTLTLAEWSEETGISYGTLHRRIQKGWSIERALTEPVNR